MSKSIVIGKGGGGSKSQDAYVPVEAANSAGANTWAKLVDIIAEGEIGGPANNGSWYQSTYFNEIPVQNADGSFNYSGVTLDGRAGTPSQDYISGFDGIENAVAVNVPVTIAGGPISRTITDSNVDSCKVVIEIPTLLSQAENGDINKTSVQLKISVTSDNGAGTRQTAVDPNTTGLIYAKYNSNYRKQFRIENLSRFGSAPWVITVERITPDSGTVKVINAFSWYSYTTVIDTKLRYYDRAVIGIKINSAQFGNQIPSRAYKVNGRNIKIPSNYNPVTRTYSGDWDGSFTVAVSNNPAWIVYDMLTDPDAGLGLIIPESMVDKYTLYSCGVYCDGIIATTTRVKQANGTYADVVSSEHRFSFNGVIEERKQGLEAVVHMCSAMRAYPIWSGGQISFVQDRPIVSPARPVSISNVSEEGFEYSGIPKRLRHTAVNVSWNDPALLGKLDVIPLVDEQGVINFGYNSIDFAAFGCTSRTEAIRRGRYVLDTDINARESVAFRGGLEFADALPGDLLSIQDPNYAAITLEGRAVSGTTTSLILDKEITFSSGITYTMLIQMPESDASERVLTNGPGTTSTLTWNTPLTEAPFQGAVLVISASNIATRKFVVMSVTEDDGFYQVSGIEYDEYKFDRIDLGVVTDIPINTTLLPSKLLPPTDLNVEAFSYTSGDQALRLFGLQISWVHSIDPRASQYELRYRDTVKGSWQPLGKTEENNYDWRPVASGVYDISVRAVGVVPASTWVTYTDFALNAVLTNLAPPTDVNTKEGNGVWSGRDCTIVWTPSVGSEFNSASVGNSNVAYYKVEVRRPDSTLIRAYDTAPGATEFTYFYDSNVTDNGTPLRQLLFYVYSVDPFGNASDTYNSVSATNPAPDMSGGTPLITDKYGYLRISWTNPTDNDLAYYKLYFGTTNPPTSVIKTINHPDNSFDVHGLDYDVSYFAQIEPYDLFGPGVKTSTSLPGSVLKIPSVNIDVELQDSITITDSVGNSAEALNRLYNGDTSTNALTYPSGQWYWIQYAYGLENYFDRIAFWIDSVHTNAFYVGYSTDGIIWNFLKAKSDNTLDGDTLLLASNQIDAQINCWVVPPSGGKVNLALFPNKITAKYIRLYTSGSPGDTPGFREIVPARIVISELAAIKHLSSYSANVGLITAGVMQSADYSSTDGLRLDLDDKTLEIRNNGVDQLIYGNGVLTIRGAYNVGAFTGYAWPASGGTGAHLSASGLLIGNANDGKYFAVSSVGNVSAPQFSIVNGNATFSGSLSAATGTFSGSLSAATGTFSGTLSAAAVSTINVTTEMINGHAVTENYATTISTQTYYDEAVSLIALAAAVLSGGNAVILSSLDIYLGSGGVGDPAVPTTGWVGLYRNGVLIKQQYPSSYGWSTATLIFTDTPGVGTFTYSIRAHNGTNNPVYTRNKSISIISLKR